MSDERRRQFSVTLILLGEGLDPSGVTRALGMFPDQSWRTGEVPKVRRPDGRWIETPRVAEWSGWKKFMPVELDGESVELQLEHWAGELESKAEALQTLRDLGWSVALDCYMASPDSERLALRTGLIGKLANFGADLDIHFYPEVGD